MLTCTSKFVPYTSCISYANETRSRTGRMEAKECAKPAVWKQARRHFYWAVRYRVARSSALARLDDANPDSTLEYRERLLDTLAQIGVETPTRAAAEALEKLDITATVMQLKGDSLARQLVAIKQQDRKAGMDALVRLMNNMSDEDRSVLLDALANSNRSPGTCSELLERNIANT